MRLGHDLENDARLAMFAQADDEAAICPVHARLWARAERRSRGGRRDVSQTASLQGWRFDCPISILHIHLYIHLRLHEVRRLRLGPREHRQSVEKHGLSLTEIETALSGEIFVTPDPASPARAAVPCD